MRSSPGRTITPLRVFLRAKPILAKADRMLQTTRKSNKKHLPAFGDGDAPGVTLIHAPPTRSGVRRSGTHGGETPAQLLSDRRARYTGGLLVGL